jgi:hypothetical protein
MGEEKRNFLRFECLIPVEISTPGSTRLLERATVHDLSSEGLKLAINLDLETGTPLEIKLNVPGKELSAYVSGEVAWTRSTKDNIEVGLKIKKIDKKIKSELLNYLFPQWVEKKKREKKQG